MIRPADGSVIRSVDASDAFYTRILSLYLSYGEGYSFADFWEQELGGDTVALISRFEDKFTLWLTDRSDLGETAAFLSFQSAGGVMFDSAYELSLPDAAHTIGGQVLEYIGDDHISDIEIYEPDFKELYELLKTCESDIFRVPEYLTFLSDLTHRKNKGSLTSAVIRDGDIAVSSAMTVSETESAVILGAVATRPDHRGRGLSRTLVRDLATRLRAGGRRVFVFSASDANTRFYINSGFTPVAGFKELFSA